MNPSTNMSWTGGVRRSQGGDMNNRHMDNDDPPARRWFITGASAGFGRTIAEAALARGDAVVATARKPAALDDLVAGAPDRVLALPLDVTDLDQVGSAVAGAVATGGGERPA